MTISLRSSEKFKRLYARTSVCWCGHWYLSYRFIEFLEYHEFQTTIMVVFKKWKPRLHGKEKKKPPKIFLFWMQTIKTSAASVHLSSREISFLVRKLKLQFVQLIPFKQIECAFLICKKLIFKELEYLRKKCYCEQELQLVVYGIQIEVCLLLSWFVFNHLKYIQNFLNEDISG